METSALSPSTKIVPGGRRFLSSTRIRCSTPFDAAAAGVARSAPLSPEIVALLPSSPILLFSTTSFEFPLLLLVIHGDGLAGGGRALSTETIPSALTLTASPGRPATRLTKRSRVLRVPPTEATTSRNAGGGLKKTISSRRMMDALESFSTRMTSPTF